MCVVRERICDYMCKVQVISSYNKPLHFSFVVLFCRSVTIIILPNTNTDSLELNRAVSEVTYR